MTGANVCGVKAGFFKSGSQEHFLKNVQVCENQCTVVSVRFGERGKCDLSYPGIVKNIPPKNIEIIFRFERQTWIFRIFNGLMIGRLRMINGN